jgi:hypothetical protein
MIRTNVLNEIIAIIIFIIIIINKTIAALR